MKRSLMTGEDEVVDGKAWCEWRSECFRLRAVPSRRKCSLFRFSRLTTKRVSLLDMSIL